MYLQIHTFTVCEILQSGDNETGKIYHIKVFQCGVYVETQKLINFYKGHKKNIHYSIKTQKHWFQSGMAQKQSLNLFQKNHLRFSSQTKTTKLTHNI